MAENRTRPSAAALFDLTNALQPIRRVWVQAVGRVIADLGIPTTLASAVVLAARRGRAGIRQHALAEEVGVNPGGLVRILDQAEAAGLLRRQESKGDRRSKTVTVLPKGRALADRVETAICELRMKLLGDLPAESIVTATRVLRTFEERIGQFLQEGHTDQ